MFTKIMTGAAAIALLIGLAPSAHSTLLIRLDDGSSTLTIADGSAGDSCAVAGCVTFNGAFNGFTVNVTTGLGYPALGSPSNPALDLNSVHVDGAGGALSVSVTQTGFTTTGPLNFDGEIGGTFSGTGQVSASYYLDLGDTAFAETDQIGSTLNFATSPFAGETGETINTDGLYSLTSVVDFSLTAGRVISFDSQLTTAVPEPTSLAILGGALLGLGWLARRRRDV